VSRGLVRADETAEQANTSLTSNRGLLLRPLDQALSDFVDSSETFRELL
jgi:hypothetical protein